MPTPIQAAATAALGDDEHVFVQRDRYERRRALMINGLAAHGLVHDGGPGAASTSGCAPRSRPTTAGRSRPASPRPGTLVAPGSLYGPAGADHVRLALSQTDDRLELRRPARRVVPARERLWEVRPESVRLRPDDADLEKQITELWEHRDDIAAVMPEAEAAAHVREAIDLLDTGEARSPRSSTTRSSSTSG